MPDPSCRAMVPAASAVVRAPASDRADGPFGVRGPGCSSDRALCSDYVSSTSRLAPARSARTSLRISSISAVPRPDRAEKSIFRCNYLSAPLPSHEGDSDGRGTALPRTDHGRFMDG